VYSSHWIVIPQRASRLRMPPSTPLLKPPIRCTGHDTVTQLSLRIVLDCGVVMETQLTFLLKKPSDFTIRLSGRESRNEVAGLSVSAASVTWLRCNGMSPHIDMLIRSSRVAELHPPHLGAITPDEGSSFRIRAKLRFYRPLSRSCFSRRNPLHVFLPPHDPQVGIIY
jgi:hypothetical protein